MNWKKAALIGGIGLLAFMAWKKAQGAPGDSGVAPPGQTQTIQTAIETMVAAGNTGAASILAASGDVSAAIRQDYATGNLVAPSGFESYTGPAQLAPVSAASEAWFAAMVAK